MEQLIPLIIMLIIGSLFRKKKGKDATESKQTKPFTAQESPQNNPVGKLKEMSRDLYRELQQEMEQNPEAPTAQRTPQVVIPAKIVEEKPPVVKRENRRNSRTQRAGSRSRVSTPIANTQPSRRATANTTSLMPKSEEDIIKGVIFSEIFGPPKSKR